MIFGKLIVPLISCRSFLFNFNKLTVRLSSNSPKMSIESSSSSKVMSTESDEVELMKKLGLDGETYLLVDIGANLTNKKYARDLDGVIQRAKDSGN